VTKLREPGSIEDALDLVIGALGMPEAVKATDRKKEYLRAASDPDNEQLLTVRDMLALDKAHIAQGGDATIWQTAGRMLKAQCLGAFSDAVTFGQIGSELVREGGEAFAAMFDISQIGNADRRTLKGALRELVDLGNKTNVAIAAVQAAIERTDRPP
jgi:hypothetical protein